VQVAIKTKGGEGGGLIVPSNVLLFRPEGLRAALVDANGKVHLQPVKIGRELGQEVELSTGVTANDRLIVNPADSLNEGDVVSVVTPKEEGTAKPAANTKRSAS
jgi:multidrug efflux system membrane fusion protein